MGEKTISTRKIASENENQATDGAFHVDSFAKCAVASFWKSLSFFACASSRFNAVTFCSRDCTSQGTQQAHNMRPPVPETVLEKRQINGTGTGGWTLALSMPPLFCPCLAHSKYIRHLF